METILVQRANVVLEIKPTEKEIYLAKGFAVIDAKGNIIEESNAQDVPTLLRKVEKLKEELKKKDAEIARLQKAAKKDKE